VPPNANADAAGPVRPQGDRHPHRRAVHHPDARAGALWQFRHLVAIPIEDDGRIDGTCTCQPGSKARSSRRPNRGCWRSPVSCAGHSESRAVCRSLSHKVGDDDGSEPERLPVRLSLRAPRASQERPHPRSRLFRPEWPRSFRPAAAAWGRSPGTGVSGCRDRRCRSPIPPK
jgi:hypothetical protein